MVEETIAVKCPMLNKSRYEDGHGNPGAGGPVMEVLLKLIDGKPTSIICPEYGIKKGGQDENYKVKFVPGYCPVDWRRKGEEDGRCIYIEKWKPLEEENKKL